MNPDSLAVRQPLRLRADPTRVVARLFVPGHPDPRSGRRVSDAVAHILDLDDEAVATGLAELVDRFGDRHRDLDDTFRQHADRIANRIQRGTELSDERWMLLGAAFTHEYSVEAAALCNPSVVLAADQSTATPGSAELVMSVRQIGEGHRSSIGFRALSVDGDGSVTPGPPGPFATAGTVGASTLHANAFRDLARRAYRVDFAPSAELDERVLYPATAVERNGIEDARFVRFEDDRAGAVYYATYTAYDGTNIVQQLLETSDFTSFESSPLQGAAARNKGLALFPRKIDGRYAALSRHNGASNAVAFSTDLRHWPTSSPLPARPALWSSIQVGNCGSPLETDAGWLVLTHGVGPMRTYSIGACLLDLEDPARVIGELVRPLLSPQPDEQDGYVPNVVYSCGAVIHRGRLVIPFGIGDASIGFATASVDEVLGEMVAPVG